MRKEEFLKQLEMLLDDISVEEREEAMAFYRSYFEDAGEGNEEKILRELESPEKVAETIKRELGMIAVPEREDNTSQNSANTGYNNTSQSNANAGYNSANNDKNYRTYTDEQVKAHNKNNNLVIILLIIIAVLTSPGWGGFLLGIAGTIFGLVVALVAITFAMLSVGIACFCAGIPMVFSISVGGGLAIIGFGFLAFALGLLLLVVNILFFGKFVPWAIAAIRNLCKTLFGKLKEAQTA